MASAVSASVKGASFLILVQVVSRAVTFVLNQLLLRYLSPELLGAATQLELYSISVLYFARESIRVALQRQSSNRQAVVNVSWIPLALGIPLATFLASLYSRSSLPNVPHISDALYLYGVASLIELCSEPCFAVVQQSLQYQTRAFAETTATIARGAATLGTVLGAHNRGTESGVLPFAYGQLAYAGVLLVTYLAGTVFMKDNKGFSLLPSRISSSSKSEYYFTLLSRPLCILSANMYLQSAIKYVLTQGDSFLIVSLASLHAQGTYALASNYGSLVARMIFQPIEESSRNLFAQLCNSTPADDSKAPPAQALDQARSLLADILKLYNIMALVAWTVGPTMAPLLLQLVAGSKWADSDAGSVLGVYCYYIPFLALNGVTEAFVAAVATNAELRLQSAMMGMYFVVFAASAYGFVHMLGLGASGLVWANCVTMSLRIVRSVQSIEEFFGRYGKSLDVQSTLPTVWSAAVALGTVASLRAASNASIQIGSWPPVFGQIVRDGAISAGFVLFLLISERNFLLHCYEMITPRKPSTKSPQ